MPGQDEGHERYYSRQIITHETTAEVFMKTIELKTVTTETGDELNYGELCRACLKAPAPQGFGIEEMRIRLEALKEFPAPVQGKDGQPDLSSFPEEVSVSEETYAELMRCVNGFRWRIADPVIVEFSDYLKSLGKKKEEDKK
jgi:hypothetical protein